jgi:hypothetical protein
MTSPLTARRLMPTLAAGVVLGALLSPSAHAAAPAPPHPAPPAHAAPPADPQLLVPPRVTVRTDPVPARVGAGV